MRIDKYLAQTTGLSRKEIKRLMHKDQVTINGQTVRDSGTKVSDDDIVTLQDQEMDAPRARYLMLYKPEGYVCSTDDPTHPTVSGLLFDEARPEALHIAGRLDVDTTGLLLITDDGQWSHRITSPKHKQGKRYLVTTADPIHPDTIQQFAEGVMLLNEKKPTAPSTLDIISEHEAYLTLTEGRYHQVKRMFAAVGNKVVALHRDRIGTIELDPELEPGEYRELTADEIALI